MRKILFPDLSSFDPEVLTGETSDRLAASDRIFLEDPRFERLRLLLTHQGHATPRELIQHLGLKEGGVDVGLGNFLVETGLVTADQMREARSNRQENREKQLWQVLREKGHLGEIGLALLFALRHGLPLQLLDPSFIDPEAAALMDAESVRRWGAFPVCFEEGELRLAVVDPTTVPVREILQKINRKLRFSVTFERYLEAAILDWQEEAESRTLTQVHSEIFLDRPAATPEADGGEEDPRSLPTIPLFNSLLRNALNRSASDIHLTPQEKALHVDFRVDGRILPHARLRHRIRNAFISRIKVVSGMDIAERRLPQDGSFRIHWSNRMVDVRVSCIPTVLGESMVLRLLDHQSRRVDLDELGFHLQDQTRIRQAVSRSHGMLLVTGPTGSGKSTTLAAALRIVQKTGEKHILTVEDPVEVRIHGITQVQVNVKTNFTFAKALRHFLRHDPDVIMVGEIRDSETAHIAVQAALTGHLVLSTLHTNDAFGAVTRLVDMGVEPYLVSAAVTLVAAQRLLRTICIHCKISRAAHGAELQTLFSLGYAGGEAPSIHYGEGCAQCGGTGYKGQTVIYEMFTMDDELRERVAHGATANQLRQAAMDRHFEPLLACGLRKILAGETTLEEVAGFLES